MLKGIKCKEVGIATVGLVAVYYLIYLVMEAVSIFGAITVGYGPPMAVNNPQLASVYSLLLNVIAAIISFVVSYFVFLGIKKRWIKTEDNYGLLLIIFLSFLVLQVMTFFDHSLFTLGFVPINILDIMEGFSWIEESTVIARITEVGYIGLIFGGMATGFIRNNK